MPGIKAFKNAIYTTDLGDGSPVAEWRLGTLEARRALYEAAGGRGELLKLAGAAFGGPIRFADCLRQTELGSCGARPDMTRDEYVAWIYGEEATFGDSFSTAYLYAWQSVAPYVASVH